MAKRIMREFRLHEISLVDQPAQRGALIRMQKKRDAAPRIDQTAALAFLKKLPPKMPSAAAIRKAFAGPMPASIVAAAAELRKTSTTKGNETMSTSSFDALVRDVQKREPKLSRQEAMQKARQENAAAFEALQATPVNKAVERDIATRALVRKGKDHAAEIKREVDALVATGLTAREAMEQLRQSKPELWADETASA